jgi:ketosteroid isomerase-like protein
VSEENVALARRCYEVVNAVGRTGDDFIDPEELAPELWARFAPDFEIHSRPDVPDSKVYSGREATKGFFRMLQETWAELRWEPGEYIDLGDAVVVETRITAVGRGSDLPLEADETHVFWFRDGEITRLQGFATKKEALEAAPASG